MSEELQDVIPTSPETAEQEQQVENISSEATAEQEVEQQTDEQKEQERKKEPWFQKRIGELTREKYEAKRAADDARREAEQLRQSIARGQQGDVQHPASDVQTLARQEAERIVAEQRLTESTDKVWATGTKEFPDFGQSVSNLQMVGMDRAFIELALTTDAPHKVLQHLGSDLDEAARILALPPVQQARELTKLEMKLSQPPAPKPVSRAPAPIKPIGGSGVASGSGLSDDLPIDEWMRRHNKR